LEGKETEVIINGKPIPIKKLKKEMARYVGCGSSSEKILGKSYNTTSSRHATMGTRADRFLELSPRRVYMQSLFKPPLLLICWWASDGKKYRGSSSGTFSTHVRICIKYPAKSILPGY
jgi:hypothetical protein